MNVALHHKIDQNSYTKKPLTEVNLDVIGCELDLKVRGIQLSSTVENWRVERLALSRRSSSLPMKTDA